MSSSVTYRCDGIACENRQRPLITTLFQAPMRGLASARLDLCVHCATTQWICERCWAVHVERTCPRQAWMDQQRMNDWWRVAP